MESGVRNWRARISYLVFTSNDDFTPPSKGLFLRRVWLKDFTVERKLRGAEYYYNGKNIGLYLVSEKIRLKKVLKSCFIDRKEKALQAHYNSLTKEQLVKIAVSSAMNKQ